MNKNQKIVFEYMKNGHFQTNVIEIEGEYEKVPLHVQEAYRELIYREQLEVLKKCILHQLKNEKS